MRAAPRPLVLRCLLACGVTLGCQSNGGAPTAEEAHRFVEAAETRLRTLGNKASRTAWVQNNFITVDTQKIAADAQSDLAAAVTELARGARRFEGLQLPYDDARKLKLLKLQLSAPAPDNQSERDELSSLSSSLEGDYGKASTAAAARDQTAVPRHRPGVEHPCVEPRSEGARSMSGRAGIASARRCASATAASSSCRTKARASWGSPIRACCGARTTTCRPTPLPPKSIACGRKCSRSICRCTPTCDRSSRQKYGAGVLPANGMLPAHLLGNMWAQDWSNIYPLVAAPASGEGYDLTAALKQRKVDERGMVKYAESFFTSLGYQPLPPAFWERSLFTKPADREVVCHASASGWDAPEDVRIKMCIEINAEDFQVVHHELGHNYYGLLYAKQPYFYRDAAIDAFHEAVGDVIALSATPGYLKQIGLIDRVPSEKGRPRISAQDRARQGRVPAVRRW